jgi:hypothetical protein
MASCAERNSVENPADIWNGYGNFLKYGEKYHTIFAGAAQHDTLVGIPVGTVTYGLEAENNIGYFYVIYDCSSSGWTISETHMYAGPEETIPLNKPLSPKIGKFPYSTNHNPRVSWFKYRVPLSTLPPYQPDPNYPDAPFGFAVATHCVVHSPANQVETGWGWGNHEFNDKAWGWYDDYTYIPDDKPPIRVLYGSSYANDSLKLFHINLSTGAVNLILQEYVGNNGRAYDGTAFDEESGMLFFVNYDTKELYANFMGDDAPSFKTGNLNGTAASGTYYDGGYYYVNADVNTLNLVTFTTAWAVASETILDTIPSTIIVNDIAMNPNGTELYILGEYNTGGKELIKWDVANETFYTTSISITSGAQIAYGTDGILYAVAPITDGSSHSRTYSIDPSTGVLTEIDDDIIIIDDPFSDLSVGPDM